MTRRTAIPSFRTPAQKQFLLWVIYPLQAFFVYLLFFLYGLLPLETASAVGGWMGRTLGPRLPANRKVLSTIATAFPELSAEAQQALALESWDNLGRVLSEYPHLDKFDDSRVELIGREHLQALNDAARPAILISGHLANWEVMPVHAAKCGLELYLIYRHANNPYVDRLLARARTPMGKHLARKGIEGGRSVHGALRRNQMIGMLVDQRYARGRLIPFFGRPSLTAPAYAELALQYNAPIVLARVERLPRARFRLTIEPPLVLPDIADHQEKIDAILTTVNAKMESWIRERPAQWLWLHRRW